MSKLVPQARFYGWTSSEILSNTHMYFPTARAIMGANERPTKKRRIIDNDQAEAPAASGNSPHTNGDHAENKTESNEAAENGDDVGVGKSPSDAFPAPVDVAPLFTALETPTDGHPLSKNQQKKLRKKQEWESKRDERRIIRKQKTQEKKQRKRERFKEAAENGDLSSLRPDRSLSQKAVQVPVTFLIDCDFDDLMLDNERISLAGQITRCYADNRKAPFRAHLSVCSFTGKLRKRFDEVLTHHKGWKHVRFHDCDFVEAAENAKVWMAADEGGTLAGAFSSLVTDSREVEPNVRNDGEIVYLTSESNNTLTELKPYSTYIIGGLVDKNREKGICYKRAMNRGVKTAKLPIGEFMEMQSRKVLATNHVNEVMLKWLECGDWGQAFLQVIPKRKGGKLKGQGDKGDDDEGKESAVAEEDSASEVHMPDEAEHEADEEVGQDIADGSS